MSRSTEELALVRAFIESAARRDLSRLPPERELAEQLGLTRTKLRSSLRKLESEGMIWRHVGKGTYLGQSPTDAKASRIAFPEIVTPREIIDARLTIEPELARLAAFNATRLEIDALRRHVRDMTAVEDIETWGELDSSFHRTLGRSSGNRLLLMMSDLLQAPDQKTIWGSLRVGRQTAARRTEADREHAEIIEAVADRDGEAASTRMRNHLRAVRAALFDDL